MRRLLPLALLLLCGPAARADFALGDGDRVVLLGSTLIEREQRHGWWELALTTRYPGKKVTFRNLGWSGDTVFGESHTGHSYTRTGNASTPKGFENLVKHARSLKPTVLVLGYGTNESFAGEKGLPKFVAGLGKLLDELAPTAARVVLLSPMRQGDLGRPFPDPKRNNDNLRLYADAIKAVAVERKATFVDLYALFGDPARQEGVTENGIHLTGAGYLLSAASLEKGLGIDRPWLVEIDVGAKKATGKGPKVEFVEGTVRVTEQGLLPLRRTLSLKGLPAGAKATVTQGKASLTHADADWAKGVPLVLSPETNRANAARIAALLRAIVDKNELYFHRWRPQNETYLFGFRKHEQGKNAVEIPKFDPLVEKLEEEIFRLNVPFTYELEVSAPR